jgi:hypothetical protein
MAKSDIPVFREARRGQILRSDDWNAVQRELRSSIRSHRHTSLEKDDASPEDLALQITTDEIADGAVTAAKLGPDVVLGDGGGGIVDKARAVDTQLIRSGSTTGVVAVAAGSKARVEHGLGSVPVGVVLGVQQRLTGLRGNFDVYGSAAKVVAAVPRKPDGSFTLVSTDDAELSVRWWAVSGSDVTPDAAPRATGKDR